MGLTPRQASAGRGARCARHVLLSAALYERWAASAAFLAAAALALAAAARLAFAAAIAASAAAVAASAAASKDTCNIFAEAPG